jgi:hypothetical protein
MQPQFSGPVEAFNFILNWNGSSVLELKDAFDFIRVHPDEFYRQHLAALVVHLRGLNPPAHGDRELIASDLMGNVLRGSADELHIVPALSLDSVKQGLRGADV